MNEYGVPSRIRLDGGSEFNHVEFLMNVLNGEDRASVMRGPSVHNQRIERLWRDVFCKVLDRFYNVFKHMEDHVILDISSPIHMYSLQFVYGTRIQNCLQLWLAAHNNHPIRTERNRTPLQLWHAGSLSCQDDNSTAMNNLFTRESSNVNEITNTVLAEYNMDEPADITVVLPRYMAPLTGAQTEELKRLVDPLKESECEGIDIYATTVQYIENCVNYL